MEGHKVIILGVYALVIGFCLSLVFFASWPVYNVIRSNGEIDYCYIEMYSPMNMSPQYQLQGHRPWRTDRMLGTYISLEEAKAKADLIGCSLEKKK